jgi:cytochrome c-type biogenesis protein CcmH
MRSLIFALSLLSLSIFATEEAYHFDNADKQQLFLELTQELRCPQCQNQNIADSDAMIAHDLRRKVYELLKQGKSREEVVEFMRSRYGDFVSYKPPVTPITVWLWLLPILFVVGAATFVLRQRKKQETDFDPAVLAKADALLEKDK